MSSLYQRTGQMLASWNGEDAGHRTDPYHFAQEVVQMVITEIREKGFPSLEQVAAHDSAKED